MKLGLVAAASLVAAMAGAPAFADRNHLDPAHGGSIDEDLAPVPLAERPRDVMLWEDVDLTAPPVVNTNIIYLNNCKPNGCVVRPGNTNSTTSPDTSSIVDGQVTLTPFDDPQATWDAVVQCMHETFAQFNVQIVTTDPGSASHFEIMIAGSPGDVGLSNGIGGISPFNCNAQNGYIPNSLVFDFSKVWGGDVEEICSTAAQEIAHSFLLDHVTEPSDPMTYNAYNGRRHFKDNVQCGSDCQNGHGPFGQTCSGQNHACTCTGAQLQDDIQTITNLFGPADIMPPVVTITSPKNGEAVQPGFPVGITVTSPQDLGLQKAELRVDNMLVQTLNTQPFAFNAPSTLGDGAHTVQVAVYDVFGTKGTGMISVIIGAPCQKPGDCPNNTDTCIGGRCVAGPGVQGGLGEACMTGNDCASGICQEDSTGAKYCVEVCDLGQGQCPSGFGCLDAGNGAGVCWPGFDDGTGGGCAAGGNGALGLGVCLGLAGLAMRRPRKR